MQFVFFHDFGAHGLEGSQAHVQRDLCGFDAALLKARKDFRSEMQARRGRGHGPAFSGIDRLITLAVAAAIFAGDVRRQRHVSQALDGREEIRRWIKADAALAEISSRHDFGRKFGFCPCSKSPPKYRRSPTPIFFPGRTRHSHWFGFLRDLLGQQAPRLGLAENPGRLDFVRSAAATWSRFSVRTTVREIRGCC